VSENGTWRPRTNKETADLYNEPDIVTEIKRNRLRWIGHVERMEDSGSVKKIFKGKPEGSKGTGRNTSSMLKMTLNSSGLGDEEGKREREREKNGHKSLRRQRPFKGCERSAVAVVVVVGVLYAQHNRTTPYGPVHVCLLRLSSLL
jgi:hypothetical protein